MTQTIPIGWINTNDMKDQFLKIAGVKNENEFYKKFPTEESFMKVHGKALKKAQMGAMIQGDASPQFNPQPINFHKLYDTNDMLITGSTQEMRDKKELAEASVAAQQKMANNRSIGAITDIGNILGNTSKAKTGKKLNKAKIGDVVDKFGGPVTVAQSIGEVIGGAQQMKDEKQRMLGAQQMLGVSDIALQASMTRPEQVRKQYIRPEDNINTGEEFFPIYGVGTTIARNGTEIANNFSPYTIYDNLEEAQNGGMFANFGNQDFMRFNKAGEETGVYNFASQGGGNALSNLTAGIGNPKGYGTSGAGRIGGAIGGTAGMLIGGPVGAMVGKVGGQMIGNLVDRKAEKTEKALGDIDKNIAKMTLAQGAQSLQRQNYSYMKQGGMVNPQMATSLEGIPLTRLFAPDPYMDTLRTGGNLRQNNVGMDGDLRTHWGGGVETISRNPYRDGSGKIEILTGNSHEEKDKYGRTGVGISVGDTGNSPFQDYAEYGSKLATGKADVEAEAGEPVTEKMEPDGSISAVVHGNLLLSKANAKMIGMPEYANKKIKDITKEIGGKEKEIEKMIQSSVRKLNELNPNNSYDLPSFNTQKLNIKYGDQRLMETANQTKVLADIQDAINRTADEFGLVADDLAKGKIKKAKMGASILKKAQNGIVTDADYNKAMKLYEEGKFKEFQKLGMQLFPDYVKSLGTPTVSGKFDDNLEGPRTKALKEHFQKTREHDPSVVPDNFSIDLPELPDYGTLDDNIAKALEYFKSQSGEPSGNNYPKVISRNKDRIYDAVKNVANEMYPFLRPTNAQRLDPRQLAGEMYALSTNQVMPVDAQLFQPELDVPYDISLQDIINQNQADYRAAQRMIGYNPAAQANLNAQKYQANQQVLGEQFRMNQAMKDRVYSQNRNILNDAKLRNLDILDKQFARQQEALSNTKATTQSALNSIAAKYAQNQLENRTLQTYENLYNYRFDPRFRAMNMNPLAQFSSDLASLPSKDLEEALKAKKEEKRKSDKPEESRNGSIVKAIKSMR